MPRHPHSTTPAVVFDLGKVLLDFDYGIAAQKLAGRCRTPFQTVLSQLDQSPLLYQFETNEITIEQFFAEIKARSGFAGDLPEFCAAFADIFSPIQSMIDWHASLRARRLPTCVFSNTNHLAIAHVRRQYPFFNNFDAYILSCEHSAMKPDPRLYQVVEKTTLRTGNDLLYIDDRPENVAAGLARGWHAIHHQSPAATIAAAEQYLASRLAPS